MLFVTASLLKTLVFTTVLPLSLPSLCAIQPLGTSRRGGYSFHVKVSFGATRCTTARAVKNQAASRFARYLNRCLNVLHRFFHSLPRRHQPPDETVGD